MVVRLPRPVLDELHAHAVAAYPEECCGFLIGRRDGDARLVERSRRAANVHPEPRQSRYSIDSWEVLQVEREFRGETRLVGIYHSHVDAPARPSAFDLARAWPWYAYVIVAVVRREPGEVTAWELREEQRTFQEIHVEPS